MANNMANNMAKGLHWPLNQIIVVMFGNFSSNKLMQGDFMFLKVWETILTHQVNSSYYYLSVVLLIYLLYESK
jgi:hypothetical protein